MLCSSRTSTPQFAVMFFSKTHFKYDEVRSVQGQDQNHCYAAGSIWTGYTFLSSSTDFFLVVSVTEKCGRHFPPDCSISLRSAQGRTHPTVQNFLLRRHAYPFDALQISFQQAVQRKSDDVVHVLKLEEGEMRVERLWRVTKTCRNLLLCMFTF